MHDEPRFIDMLEVLVRHRVDFIVVGGVAAIVHGSPLMTGDLDILHDPKPENIPRVLAALLEMNAIYRDPAGRRIPPDEYKLSTFRMNLMKTDLGPLDILRSIGSGLSYSDLLARSEEFVIAGFQVRVLNLEAIIESKEYADRPKDRIAIPYLREILEMKKST